MSLFNSKFENAAKALAESEDEVLQAAGLMAQMRLETLKLRLRGSHGTRALTPWSTSSPRFTFGIPPHVYNPTNIFASPYGQSGSTGFFGAPSAQNPPRFGSGSGVAFGSAPATFSAPQSLPAAMPSNQEITADAAVNTTTSSAFGSNAQGNTSSGNSNNENNGHTFGTVFGIPNPGQNQLDKN